MIAAHFGEFEKTSKRYQYFDHGIGCNWKCYWFRAIAETTPAKSGAINNKSQQWNHFDNGKICKTK